MASERVYILTAHADPASYTISATRRLAQLIEDAGGQAQVTNLYDIGFNPAFTRDDLATYRAFLGGRNLAPPADVRAEQDKLLGATAFVPVFPVYWWAMPAQVKGWFDRVLTSRRGLSQGAYSPADSVVAHLSAHVLAITGGSEEGYGKRGYGHAMRTQIETGILQYSGFSASTWTWLWDRYEDPRARLGEACRAVVDNIARHGTLAGLPR